MKSRRQRQQLANSDVVQDQQGREFQSSQINPLSYSYAGHYGVTPEIYMPDINSDSQQICILILEFIMPAFGELRFHLVLMLRMLGTARFFISILKKSKQNKNPKPDRQTKFEAFRNTKSPSSAPQPA